MKKFGNFPIKKIQYLKDNYLVSRQHSNTVMIKERVRDLEDRTKETVKFEKQKD